MSILDSRYIGMIDVPEPQEITARFVYNFFVQNERTDRSGTPKFQGVFESKKVTKKGKQHTQRKFKKDTTQRFVDARTLELRQPRYIEIIFDPVKCGSDNIEDLNDQPILTDPLVKGKTNTEDTVTSLKDGIYRYTDSSVRSRLTQKARMVASVLDADSNKVSDQVSLIIKNDESININDLQEILSPGQTPGVEYVNSVGDVNELNVFSLAASLKLDTLIDRRLSRASLAGDYTYESTLKTKNLKIALMDNNLFSSFLKPSNNDSFEPTLTVIKSEKVSNPSDLVKSMTVGYIIERSETLSTGKHAGNKKFLIDDSSSTNFLDTKVVYGSTYTYTVRTVALIEMIIDTDGKDTDLDHGFYKVWSLVSSRPSRPSIIEAIERIPPLEPDGVFYKYNYDGGGLAIRWQIPVGKQRDVKYFQVFRRKTIYEPFTCVAELDFDDSTIITTRSENILKSRVYKFNAPITQFIDHEYTRDSSYIYAVVALDAHGLTSGYSAQSLVTFDKTRNSIELKNISKSGAPKQYPNFFIDPDLDDNIFVDSLTQDAMFSSHKKKINIYFDPDSVGYTSSNGQNGAIILTQNENAVYQLHLMNIDRQKSSTVELSIENLGSS